MNDNVFTKIATLRISSDEVIHQFYVRFTNLKDKLTNSTEKISKKKLLEKYLNTVSTFTSHYHRLQYHITDLNLHNCKRS